ncbi:MAG: hypothetical protein AAGH79_01330 [Bacteroidota bacterium]
MKWSTIFSLLICWSAVCWQCAPAPENANAAPTEPTYLQGEADDRAAEWANKVMDASGGLQAWQEAAVLQWNFFGRRLHTWDKQKNINHVSYVDGSLDILIDLNKQTGRVWLAGTEQSNPDTLAKYLDLGNRLWINDSYWVFLPYKLRDPGTKLSYLGVDTTDNQQLESLELVFTDSVGVTPQNKYHIYIDPSTNLMAGWSYFPNRTDSIAQFRLPWAEYKDYGPLRLSGSRGKYEISEIAYLEEWPEDLATLNMD